MTERKIPSLVPRTKGEVQQSLAEDWLRVAPMGTRPVFAAKIGESDPRKISKAISGENLPEAHTILNSLVADPAALFNTFQLFGGCFVSTAPSSQGDMATISAMLHAATEYLDRMKDNRRCHTDTAELAKLFIPLVPAMLAIINEADALRRQS